MFEPQTLTTVQLVLLGVSSIVLLAMAVAAGVLWWRRHSARRGPAINWLALPPAALDACKQWCATVDADALLDGKGHKRERRQHGPLPFRWRLVAEVAPGEQPLGRWRVLRARVVRDRVGVWLALVECEHATQAGLVGHVSVANVDEEWLFRSGDSSYRLAVAELARLVEGREWVCDKEFR